MKDNSMTATKANVMTAFFAAIIYLGIQVFRIPMPAAVGTPFLHFGHIFIVLALLCLTGKRATIAAVMGLLLFDVLNGYMHAIPNVLVSTLVKCIVCGLILASWNKKAPDARKQYANAICLTVIYAILNILTDFVWNVAELTILGSKFSAAFMAELASIPATCINGVFAVIGVAVLFVPIKRAYSMVVR